MHATAHTLAEAGAAPRRWVWCGLALRPSYAPLSRLRAGETNSLDAAPLEVVTRAVIIDRVGDGLLSVADYARDRGLVSMAASLGDEPMAERMKIDAVLSVVRSSLVGDAQSEAVAREALRER